MSEWTMQTFDCLTDAKSAARQAEKTCFLCHPDAPANTFTLFSRGGACILIQDYDSGIQPAVMDFGSTIWVRTNFCFMCLDAKLNLLNSTPVLAPVYDFLYSPASDCVIAVCEIDIFCLTMQGDLLWHKALDDILSEYALTGNMLSYTLFEGKACSLDITTAKPV
ncbi:MAG: hypothetical protein IKK21_07750 [Clostridia bacterium]|nr:hypothetical protein [Clostridia bacterium]